MASKLPNGRPVSEGYAQYTMLEHFLASNREEIIERCRSKVAQAGFPLEAEDLLEKRGVPLFLSQLTQNLHADPPPGTELELGAMEYGKELERLGFTVDQVVHMYGNVCQSVTDLAVELKAPIPNADFRIMNRCLDDAIAYAVSGFGGQRDKDSSDLENIRSDERLVGFVDQVEALTDQAMAAFNVIKGGAVGIGGSTGGVLERSLEELRALSNGALAELRFTAHTGDPGSP